MNPVDKTREAVGISEQEYQKNVSSILAVVSTKACLSNLTVESGQSLKIRGKWKKRLGFSKKSEGISNLVESTLKMALCRLNQRSEASREEAESLTCLGSYLYEAYKQGKIKGKTKDRIATLSHSVRNKAVEVLKRQEAKTLEILIQRQEAKELDLQQQSTLTASLSRAILDSLGDGEEAPPRSPRTSGDKHRITRSRTLTSAPLELLALEKIAALQKLLGGAALHDKRENRALEGMDVSFGEAFGNPFVSGEFFKLRGDEWYRRNWARVKWLQAGGDRSAEVRSEIFGRKSAMRQDVECNPIEIVQKLANSGDVRAQYEQGMHFLRQSQLPGSDQAKKYKKAKAQLESAANNDSAPAKIALRRIRPIVSSRSKAPAPENL